MPRIRIGIQPIMLDPDPDEMNADPQLCLPERTYWYWPGTGNGQIAPILGHSDIEPMSSDVGLGNL
jgi:hypothetical protein